MTTPQLPADLIRKIMSYSEKETDVLSFDEFKMALKDRRNMILKDIAECQKEYINKFHYEYYKRQYYKYYQLPRIEFRIHTYTLEDFLWARDYMTVRGWNVRIDGGDWSRTDYVNHRTHIIVISQTLD